VLALVIEQPSYGYEVWQRFDARFGGLLDVGASRIYQAFDALLDAGLIEEVPGTAHASRRQPRPSYRTTAAGRRQHRAWVVDELHRDPERLELGRRLLASVADDAVALRELIDRYEQACLDEMAQLAPADADADPDASGSAVAERLLAEERRLVLEARMKWILFARRQLGTS